MPKDSFQAPEYQTIFRQEDGNMIRFDDVPKIWLACQPQDMRKGISRLSVIVQDTLLLNPFEDALFLFTNKTHKVIKMLYWDGTGFWLLRKRMGKGTYKWPKNEEESVIEIDHRQLGWLLDGLKITQKTAFEKLNPTMV